MAFSRVLTRELINVANGYEPNESSIVTDRFSSFEATQRDVIELLQIRQQQLEQNKFAYLNASIVDLRKASVVDLHYLNDNNQVYV